MNLLRQLPQRPHSVLPLPHTHPRSQVDQTPLHLLLPLREMLEPSLLEIQQYREQNFEALKHNSSLNGRLVSHVVEFSNSVVQQRVEERGGICSERTDHVVVSERGAEEGEQGTAAVPADGRIERLSCHDAENFSVSAPGEFNGVLEQGTWQG